MSILEELWLGQISPIEDAVPRSEEYVATLHHITTEQQRLERLLPQNARPLLASYNDAQIKLQGLSERNAFAEGFRLGSQIMLAVLDRK